LQFAVSQEYGIRVKEAHSATVGGQRVQLRPVRANPVWGYDLVSGMTIEGREQRMLESIDE